MSDTRDLINAIEAGDSIGIQTAFETAMANRIADRMDTMRQEVAQNMFKQPVAESEAVVDQPAGEAQE